MFSPFSYIFILLIFIILLKSKNIKKMYDNFLLLALFLCGISFNMGSFMILGNMDIEYNDTILAILFVLSIVQILKNKKLNKKLFTTSIILIIAVAIGIINCYTNPADIRIVSYDSNIDMYFRGDLSQLRYVVFSKRSILMFCKFLMFIVIMNALKVCYSKDDLLQLAKKVVKYMRYIIYVGLLEFIVKIILKIDLLWFYNLFTTNLNKMSIYSFDRLQGLSREPSYFSIVLFNFVILKFLINCIENKKSIDKFIVVAIVLGFLSKSFSFVICLVSILLFYLFVVKLNKKQKIITLFSILFVIFLVTINMNSIVSFMAHSNNNILVRAYNSINVIQMAFSGQALLYKYATSEFSRLAGAFTAVKNGLVRPFFGIGLGTVYCINGMASIFSNTGLLGLILWIILLFKKYADIKSIYAIFIILLPTFFCGSLYTLYDLFYLILLPTVGIFYERGFFYEQ